MTFPLAVVAVAAGLTLVASAAPAQQEPGGPLFIPVSVADSRGRPVPNLAAADFTVSIGDTVRTATVLEPDRRPLSVVVIIDGVESTEVLDARAALTEVLKVFRTMAEGVRVGLILGDEGARVPELKDAVMAGAEHNRRVSQFFRAPQTQPPPDTLRAATAALAREEDRRHVVLMLSVNRRAGTEQYLEEVVREMQRANVILGAVETGPGSDQALWLIHNTVGGHYERVGDVAALSLAGGRLARTFMSAYQVTVDAAGAARGPVRVEVKGRKNLMVIAPSWAK